MASSPTVLAYDPDSGLSLSKLEVHFSLHAFLTSSDAVAGLSHLHPDVVVAQFDSGGVDLCRHVIQRDPVMPVILLCQNPSSWDILEGLRAGARDVVVVDGDWVKVLEERVDAAVQWRALVNQDAEAQVQSFMVQAELYQQQTKTATGKASDLQLQLRAEKALVTQTEQQLELQRELAMAAVRAKGAFLANMTHELHTPLNAIIGYAEMLREELADENAGDANKIIESGQRLLHLLQDVLNLAKLESGEVHPIFEPVLVQELVDRCVRDVTGASQRNQVELVTKVDPTVRQVVSDPRRLAEAIGHLLDNAVKFGSEGTVELEVGREGDGVVFTVADQGIGFQQGDLERMLGAFNQVDEQADRGFGGAGMGLAIAHQLARVLGGKLSADGVVGQGAKFAIWLPEVDDATVEEGGSREVTVLVIDDDPVLRRVLQHMLVADGHRVVTSANPEDALALAREHKPSLIALDVLLPGIDGITLLTRIKEDPELQSIPVVMLSATDDSGRSVELGACGFLQKPVTRERLQQIIRANALPPSAVVMVVDGAPSSVGLENRLRAEGIQVRRTAVGEVATVALDVEAVLIPVDLPLADSRTLLASIGGLRDVPVVACGSAGSIEERAFLESMFTALISSGSEAAGQLRDLLHPR